MTKSDNSKKKVLITGLLMGAADIVPGVSGGTIAFVSGIYDELLDSIKSLNPKAVGILYSKGIKEFWSYINGSFLVTLLVGILTSVFTLASVFLYLLEEYPVLLWAFFFGLILASSISIGKKIAHYSIPVVLSFVVGVAVAYTITTISPSHINPTNWTYFLSGAFAICAMILPGISGSFILLLVGMYVPVITAVKSFDLITLIIFASGCGIGLICFSHFLSFMLKNHKQETVALLTGFMLGALSKVWPWKQDLEFVFVNQHKQIPLVQKNVMPFSYELVTGQPAYLMAACCCVFFGFLLIYVFDRFSNGASD